MTPILVMIIKEIKMILILFELGKNRDTWNSLWNDFIYSNFHAHKTDSIFPLLTGLTLTWITSILWLSCLGYPDDHWETQAGRQRLHQTFHGPFHWLHAGFQESCCTSHAKGNAYIFCPIFFFYKMPRGFCFTVIIVNRSINYTN